MGTPHGGWGGGNRYPSVDPWMERILHIATLTATSHITIHILDVQVTSF